MKAYFDKIKENWSKFLHIKNFRWDLIGGLVALFFITIFTYFFFDYIENRAGGVVMKDWVLLWLPARDVSIPIVFFEITVIILFIIRSTTNPDVVITFLIAYIFVLITRSVTIGITQLRPPNGLIELRDPIAGLIYRSKLSNRDLFYSGHTSLLFLIYLCSTKKIDRYYMLLATIVVGILLLIQHVHYTVDVVCAPFFAFGCYWLSKKITRISSIPTTSKV